MTDDSNERAARFSRLYEQHFEAIRAYAWRRGPDFADDVTAETFTIAWRRLDDVPGQPLPWLYGVARNVMCNLGRAERRRLEGERLGAGGGITRPFTTALEEGSALRAALERLSERDCEVLMLAAWERLDRSGLAAVLGCSKSTATVRLFRARRRLSAALAEAEAPPCICPTDPRGRLLDES